jgi:hypothetical protein
MIHSWELGTLAEALTEYESPHLSVFAPRSIPPPAHLKKGEAKDVLSIAKKCACSFPSKPFPLWEVVMRCADAACPQLNVESLQKNRPISSHSSIVVQSGILLVSLCSFSFLFSFSH